MVAFTVMPMHRGSDASLAAVLTLVALTACARAETNAPGADDDVASVQVMPASRTLAIGETHQFHAEARDAEGRTLAGRTVSWRTDDPDIATVDAAGLVHGMGSGSTQITAMVEAHEGTATLTVSESASEILFRDDFESGTPLTGGDGVNDRRWGDVFGASVFTVVSDDALPFDATSGSHVLRIGSPGGSVTHWVKQELGGATPQARSRLYLSLRLYLPSSWTGPIRFMMIRGSRDPWGSFGVGGSCPSERAPEDEYIAANVLADPIRMYTYWIGMDKFQESPPVCWGTSGLLQDDTPKATYVLPNAQLLRNSWNQVEMELQLNTPGTSDGWERIWLNGALVMEHLNVEYRRHAGTLLQAVTLDTGNITQTFYVDDVMVAAQRP